MHVCGTLKRPLCEEVDYHLSQLLHAAGISASTVQQKIRQNTDEPESLPSRDEVGCSG